MIDGEHPYFDKGEIVEGTPDQFLDSGFGFLADPLEDGGLRVTIRPPTDGVAGVLDEHSMVRALVVLHEMFHWVSGVGLVEEFNATDAEQVTRLQVWSQLPGRIQENLMRSTVESTRAATTDAQALIQNGIATAIGFEGDGPIFPGGKPDFLNNVTGFHQLLDRTYRNVGAQDVSSEGGPFFEIFGDVMTACVNGPTSPYDPDKDPCVQDAMEKAKSLFEQGGPFREHHHDTNDEWIHPPFTRLTNPDGTPNRYNEAIAELYGEGLLGIGWGTSPHQSQLQKTVLPISSAPQEKLGLRENYEVENVEEGEGVYFDPKPDMGPYK